MIFHGYMMMMTVDDKDRAYAIAETMIQRKLAAFAEVSSPVATFYRWNVKGEDKVLSDLEWRVILFTSRERTEVEKALLEMHSGSVPKVISVSMEPDQGFADYMARHLM